MVHIFGSSFGATIVRNILFLECEKRTNNSLGILKKLQNFWLFHEIQNTLQIIDLEINCVFCGIFKIHQIIKTVFAFF